jgi:hypothetical protein
MDGRVASSTSTSSILEKLQANKKAMSFVAFGVSGSALFSEQCVTLSSSNAALFIKFSTHFPTAQHTKS